MMAIPTNILARYVPNTVQWYDCEFNTLAGHDDAVKSLVDLSKNGYDATIHGALAYDNGYVFDGNIANYITTPSITELISSDEITHEVSFNIVDTASTQRAIFADYWIEVFIRRGLNVAFEIDGGTIEAINNHPINTGFHTVAVTFKANDYQKIYLDGEEIYSVAAKTKTATNSSMNIGQAKNQYPLTNGTKFYALRSYNKVLTLDELKTNYSIDKERWD